MQLIGKSHYSGRQAQRYKRQKLYIHLQNGAHRNDSRNIHQRVYFIRCFWSTGSLVHIGSHGYHVTCASKIRPQSHALVFLRF